MVRLCRDKAEKAGGSRKHGLRQRWITIDRIDQSAASMGGQPAEMVVTSKKKKKRSDGKGTERLQNSVWLLRHDIESRRRQDG